MGNINSFWYYEPNKCSKCLRSGTLLEPITPCVRCRHYLCVHCSKSVPLSPCGTSWPILRLAYLSSRAPRCCFSCGSPLLSLNDEILRYIMLFLTYKNQDRLLRVCTRFHSVLLLPYEYVKNIEEKYIWKDPHDILYASRRSIILRGVDRLTGAIHALKLIPKSQMLSRRLWQRLQQCIDIRRAASAYSEFFVTFHGAFQTRDFIVLVMDLLPSEKYQSLSSIIQCGKLTETKSRLIIARLLEAVRCLHDELHVVHRELSLDAVFVARDNFEDVHVLHFHYARFLKPSPHSSYLQEIQRQQQLQKQTEASSCLVPNSVGFGNEDREAPSMTALLHVKQFSKPPPLSLPQDFGLLRKAGFYAKLARDREAQLQEAATRSQGFSHSTFETQRYCGSTVNNITSVSGTVLEFTEGDATIPFSMSPKRQPNPTEATLALMRKKCSNGNDNNTLIFSDNDDDNNSITTLSPPLYPAAAATDGDNTNININNNINNNDINNNNNNNNENTEEDNDDDFLIVATPRASATYAAPELSAALCSQSIVPSLTIRAVDVKKWDVFAIGGIFYRLLASSLHDHDNSLQCPDWDILSAVISRESIVLLLSLMHFEPSCRASCREALKILCEQFGDYTPESVQ
ncbi:uncharacterized protein TM35_000151940 [Trypanosoma theileri]|uniref:Protein kinase domain-containing protein n=1 Tax=Trypanosoma theileri TaxID=67003 RepID=A0A1X0NWA3_9TRYP|nr:uncharacterized protein TM35_000151940 [Trypanosoma theileri]ORC88763.1 hypothetical protein TM35_000151940 [Trypanosoma theileri]